MKFIPAKEKTRFAKEWRKVLAKDHVIRIDSHEVFNTALMENPIKMDDLGVPPFSETAICKIYLPKHAVATLYMMGQGTPSCLEFRFLKDVVLEFGFFVGGSKIDFNRVR